jgi:hypothetical protein
MKFRTAPVTAGVCLAAFPLLVGSDRPQVTPLSFGAETFVQSFNAASGRPRLVGVFSPTCAHCLQTCADVQEILERHPEALLEVFILWAPLEPGDNLGLAASAASTYLPDRRVRHFWDLWKFASRSYSNPFRIPLADAWGLLIFYGGDARWEREPPAPEFWMQSRRLRVGTAYSKRLLERKLGPWLRPREGDSGR